MVVQPGNTHGVSDAVLVWLSEGDAEDCVIQDILAAIKQRHRVCVYRSGQAPGEEVYRRVILDNAAEGCLP
ncbi:hypothetical protein DFR58_11028 [Anaerobacterium chartisolvens]|uniref:Uncharacterized protein n=1 Tax=Anaerobacterium chartisolvens TaxID=1297424 RepID=A0A369B5D3_9FIRM|nr:hypothetical protein [Anaerobacterium chartisolvens]RCX16535.1 hypothetical protein DFR58_11028 [Anaerobacterium chartisolvens]